MRRAVLSLSLVSIATLHCRDATDIRASSSSEVDCSKGARVAVVVASSSEALRDTAPSAVSTRCVPKGDGTNDTGSVVFSPATSNDEPIAFAMMTRPDGEDPETCTDPAQAKSCIVARRQLRFSPHDDVVVPVELRLSCLGVTCPADQTCRRGECVSDVVPAHCDACGETELGGSSTPACGAMGGLEPGAPWPTAGFCPTRPGRSGRLGPQRGVVRWKVQTGGIASMSPAVGADGTVYIGSNDRNVYAVASDGHVAWNARVGSNVNDTGFVIGANAVYVGCADGNVYAFSKSGTQLWATGVQSDVAFPPTVGGDGTLFVSGVPSPVLMIPVDLYALAPDGSVRWHVAGPYGGSAPTVGQNGTVYMGGTSNALVAIRPSDGGTLWTAPASGPLSTPSVGDDGTIYATDSGALYAFDPNGQRRWSAPLDGGSKGVAIAPDGTIHVAASSGTLYAITPDGKTKWTVTTGVAVQPPIVGGDGTVYLGGGDGALYAVSKAGVVRFTVATGGSINSQPAIGADGTLYVVSSDGALYAIGP